MELEFEEQGSWKSASATDETRTNTIEELKQEVKELEHRIELHERGEGTLGEDDLHAGLSQDSVIMSYKERIVAKKEAIERLEKLG